MGTTRWSEQTVRADGFPNIQTMPVCWLLPLQAEEWPGRCKAALFHTTELWLKVLPVATTNISDFIPHEGGNVAIVHDRSSGVGAARMLYWEVELLDSHSDNVMTALAGAGNGAQDSLLASELASVL